MEKESVVYTCPETGEQMMDGDVLIIDGSEYRTKISLLAIWSEGVVAPNNGKRPPLNWYQNGSGEAKVVKSVPPFKKQEDE